MIINVEVETDDIDQHDSQMVTQEISDVEDDADDHVQGEESSIVLCMVR